VRCGTFPGRADRRVPVHHSQ